MEKENLIRPQPPPYESTAYTQPTAPLMHPPHPGGHLEGYQRQPLPQPQHPQGYAPPFPGNYAPPAFIAERKIIHGGIWCLAITSICCCTLLGIVALAYAISGNDKEKRQDYQEATRSAKLVKIFGALSITIGVSLWIACFIMGVVLSFI